MQALVLINNAPKLEYAQDSFETKERPEPAAISIPVDDKDSQLKNREHSSLALHVLERLAGNRLQGADLEVYRLLVRIYRQCGWDELLGVRSQVFLMEEEFIIPSHPCPAAKQAKCFDEKEAFDFSKSPILAPSPSLPANQAINLANTEKKVCERWFDRLFSVLFEDLRVFEVFAKEIEEKRVSLKAGREWFLLGKLCLRLQKKVASSRHIVAKACFL